MASCTVAPVFQATVFQTRGTGGSMTSIVGVHGIGKYHYYEDAGGSAGGAAEAMRAKWNAYLHQGLTGRADGAGDYFSEIAYYAHHLHSGPPAPPRQMAVPAKLVLADWAVQL